MFSGELSHDRVVGDLRLHLAVLVCKLLILVLHFFLIELSQLLHFTVFLFLFVKTNGEERNACHEQDSDNNNRNQNFFVHIGYLFLFL